MKSATVRDVALFKEKGKEKEESCPWVVIRRNRVQISYLPTLIIPKMRQKGSQRSAE